MTPNQDSDVTPDTQALYAAAHQLLVGSKPRDAAVLFRLMLHVAPADERSWLGLGACHEAIGQLDVASKLYVMGHTAANSARCLICAARAYAKLGRDDDADDSYEHAIDSAENNEEPELVRLALAEKALIHVR